MKNESSSSIVLSASLYLFVLFCSTYVLRSQKAVGRCENPGVPAFFSGHNLPPLVEIGLTDLPKFGGAIAPAAPPGTTHYGPGLPKM